MSAIRVRTVKSVIGRLTAVAGAVCSLILAAPNAAYAAVTVVPDDTARVNGTVYAVAQVGTRTIIGGDFTAVGGQPRNHVAAIRADGRVDPDFKPDANGTVYALAGSADAGTVFIGGLFTEAGGVARANLAAVDATSGSALAGWTADTIGATPEVLALTVSAGRLYVGGRFGGIDGTGRKRIAALDGSGNLIRVFDPAPNLAAVKFLATNAAGTRVYAGGAFDLIGGQSRPAGVAELDAATGLATPFNPQPVGSVVVAMGISPGADRLYFGVADNRVFAYDVPDSRLLWTIKNGGDTQAIAATAGEIYLGGHFSQNTTQKVKRKWIQSVNAAGAVTDWDPKLAGGRMGVWDLAITPAGTLLVGGEFTTINGLSHPRFARFPAVP